LSNGSQAESPPRRDRTGVWPTYARLLGYALRYKFRIAAMILLALFVAGSLASMLMSAGIVVDILYISDDRLEERIAAARNRAESIAQPLEYVGVSSEAFGERVDRELRAMRDDRGRTVRMLIAALVALTAVGALSRFLQEYYAGSIGASVITALQEEMHTNILNLSHVFFEKRSSGEIVTRFTSDAFMVRQGLLEVFVKLIQEPIKIAMFLGLAYTVSPALTFLVLFALAPVLVVVVVIGNTMKRAVHRSLDRIATMVSSVSETVRGISIVKVFQMEDSRRARMAAELAQLRRQLKNIARADAAVSPATEFILVLGISAFLGASFVLVEQGGLAGGQLITLFGALALTIDPMRRLAKLGNLIHSSAASAGRVFEYIDMAHAVQDRPGAKPVPVLRESIRFDDVHFRYGPNDPDVLKGVSFAIAKGEMVALVGFSGAGKSTIAKLLPRFYDVTGGAIRIDGTDIRDVSLESLRGQIGMVTQESILFSDSIRENIAYGRENVAMEAVERAARGAHADEFIDDIEGRYDAMLSEAGGNLSGGQRQRVSIARAMLKDAPILILDEATSSLDAKSEQAILSALDEFIEGRTTIVIAHRLSTIRKADRIVVLDEGRVVEEGTHDELLARGGFYRRLFEMQFQPTANAQPAS
jgi:ATP-binding cassette, subfamily B, bacterial MsbA